MTRFPSRLLASGALSLVLLSGCISLAPDYERADAPIPDALPSGAGGGATSPLASEAEWREVFTDPALRQVIEIALENNRDLRVATLNVQAAQARYGITRAARFPTINGSVTVTEQGTFDEGDAPQDVTDAAPLQNLTFDQATAQLAATSYEVDLFGRVTSLNDEALQRYFATAENARAAHVALVGSVADAWLGLVANKQLLALAEQTAESQAESLDLTEALFDAGVASDLDYQRAATSVEQARADIAQFKADVRRSLNALRFLAGDNLPGDVLAAAEPDPSPVRLDLAATRSSDVLLSRPDVLAAERTLRAANANIGAARAAFFPRITLTGSAGYASSDLDGLFSDGTGLWSFSPSVSLPIFAGGANISNLRLSKTQREIALAQYEQAIQAAFRETADALAVAETIDERIGALERLTNASEQALYLSEERLREGVDSYLSVLDAQRSVYQAQQALIAARTARASNAVALYRALGGWPEDAADRS